MTFLEAACAPHHGLGLTCMYRTCIVHVPCMCHTCVLPPSYIYLALVIHVSCNCLTCFLHSSYTCLACVICMCHLHVSFACFVHVSCTTERPCESGLWQVHQTPGDKQATLEVQTQSTTSSWRHSRRFLTVQRAVEARGHSMCRYQCHCLACVEHHSALHVL